MKILPVGREAPDLKRVEGLLGYCEARSHPAELERAVILSESPASTLEA